MKCLAEFLLDSDLILVEGCEQIDFESAEMPFVLELSNTSPDQVHVLKAILIFEVEQFSDAKDLASTYLATALNSLTFTTSRKFRLGRLIKLIEWTKGLEDRRAKIFCEQDAWAEAEPALDEALVGTAAGLVQKMQDERMQAALRWYRLGISAENLEEQYSYFWFALEIASVANKDQERVPSSCPHCRGALFCPACNKEPQHKKFAGEAIRHMIYKVLATDEQRSLEVADTLMAIRHELMHGGRIANVKLPCSPAEALHMLSTVAWRALAEWINLENVNFNLNFGAIENVTRAKIVAVADVVVKMPGDADAPKLSDFPKIEVELIPVPVDDKKRSQ